jgi:hypothetical protein
MYYFDHNSTDFCLMMILKGIRGRSFIPSCIIIDINFAKLPITRCCTVRSRDTLEVRCINSCRLILAWNTKNYTQSSKDIIDSVICTLHFSRVRTTIKIQFLILSYLSCHFSPSSRGGE